MPVAGSFSYDPSQGYTSLEGNNDTGDWYSHPLLNMKFKSSDSNILVSNSNDPSLRLWAHASEPGFDGPYQFGIDSSIAMLAFRSTTTVTSLDKVEQAFQTASPMYDYGHGIVGSGFYLDASGNPQSGFMLTAAEGSFRPITESAITIKITDGGAGIEANFTPNFGLSLADAATILGLKGFNWYQLVTNDPYPPPLADSSAPPLKVPYVDPPQGGYAYQLSQGHFPNNYPFYYNSEDLPLVEWTDPSHTAHDSSINNTLMFHDIPQDGNLKPGEFLEFFTALVGIEEDGSLIDICHFKWASNFNRSAQTGGVSWRSDQFSYDDIEGTGGVSILETDLNVNDLPLSIRKKMIYDGFKNIPTDTTTPVPEPTTLLMFCTGLIGLSVLIRKK